MAKSAYSAQEKYELIVAFKNRQASVRDFYLQYNISQSTIKDWIYLFQTFGVDGLHDTEGWKRYSTEVKTAAVLDAFSGNYSLSEIVRKQV